MKRIVALVVAVVAPVVIAAPLAFGPTATAHHQPLNGPHWPGRGDRAIRVLDSLTPKWNTSLTAARAGWSAATGVDLRKLRGSDAPRIRRRCPAKLGHVRVCDYNYAGARWAGLATTWYDRNRHIAKVTVRLNTKFVKSPKDMRVVTCHELGHSLGLEHRRQSANTSCMTPFISSGSTPDKHDLQTLVSLYSHNESASYSASDAGSGADTGGPYTVVREELYPRS